MILETQIKCYDFYKINNDNGLLEYVDATYILHLENNGRINNIIEQIKIYNITQVIYILFNKGYKNCDKGERVNFSLTDLIDANIKVFEHAKNNNFTNILVLEDDFFFNPIIKDKFTLNNVNNFLSKFKTKKL